MYELSVRTHFSGAHCLRGYDGACANLHGHNWEVEVFLRGECLDEVGLLVDFKQIKAALRAVLEPLDHTELSRLEAFSHCNPTSENLARHIFQALSRRLNNDRARVHRVRVSESPGSTAVYWDEP